MNQMSEQIDQLAGALCAAQAELKHAKKGADNPFFKSKYADLTSVIEAVRGPLHKHGLSFTQIGSGAADGDVGLRTILMHKSGQWIASDLCVRPVKNDPQAYGSAMTYARRYGLQSIVGVSAEEDDDGNAASGNRPAPKEQPQKKVKWTEAQGKQLIKAAEALGMTDVDRETFKGWLAVRFNVDTFADIPSIGKASHVVNNFADLYDEWKTA